MTTHNGVNWVAKQLDSILMQSQVNVQIFVSDDMSSDGSAQLLKQMSLQDKRIRLLDFKRSGSAGLNFYRLIQEVNIDEAHYIAFSDQDDIWEANKLISHIQLAEKNHADGVSSNVIAFWPDGRKRLIAKSQQQKKWDYLFESAGPGCTFLMTPWLVKKVREQLINPNSLASQVVLHDWLTYAVCRAHGHKWVIDSTPSMYYRQHSNNVVGANVGLKAKFSRLKKLKQGWYRTEVIKVAAVCELISNQTEIKRFNVLLNEKSFISQLKLLTYVSQARRYFLDQWILFILITCFLF